MSPETPHPLTAALIARLRPGARILLIGVGGGRHVAPLRAAGCFVSAVDEDATRVAAARTRFADDPGVRVQTRPYATLATATPCDAALSTHAYLHGAQADVARGLAALGRCVVPGAPLHLTFGSHRDPRAGIGVRIDARAVAPRDGPEAGIPHLYLDEPALREMLAAFTVEALDERAGATGSWGHDAAEAARIRHWYARLRTPTPSARR